MFWSTTLTVLGSVLSPWWAIAAMIATPLLAFLGVMLGHALTRRSARELDTWRRREESMRMLRWAVELAASSNSQGADVGLEILKGLLDSELIQDIDRAFVTVVAETVGASTTALALDSVDESTYNGLEQVEEENE